MDFLRSPLGFVTLGAVVVVLGLALIVHFSGSEREALQMLRDSRHIVFVGMSLVALRQLLKQR